MRPIDRLKNLLDSDSKLTGEVLGIRDNEYLIATNKGLQKANVVTGIAIGDTVVLYQGTVTKVSTISVPTYYV